MEYSSSRRTRRAASGGIRATEDSARSNGDRIVTEPGASPPTSTSSTISPAARSAGLPPGGRALPADGGAGAGPVYTQVGVEGVLYPLQDDAGVAAIDPQRHPHGSERFQAVLRAPVEARGQRLVVQVVEPAPAPRLQPAGQDAVQGLDAAHLEQVLPFVDDQGIEAFQSGPAAVEAHPAEGVAHERGGPPSRAGVFQAAPGDQERDETQVCLGLAAPRIADTMTVSRNANWKGRQR